MKTNGHDRRRFLEASGAAVAAAASVGMHSSRAAEESRTIGLGFVGVGNRGAAHLKNAVKTQGVEVRAICDIDEEAARQAADVVEKAGAKRPAIYKEWKELLARDDVTAVVSALPCDLHYENYRDTLAAGKHLYGEKPMCLEAGHADALVHQSASAGVVFQIGYQRRFSKQLQRLVELFRLGIIGVPFEGRGVRYGSGGPYRKPGEWLSFRKQSGDWMLEQAVHHWDALNWILGELPVSAYGIGRQDLFKDWDPKRDVSDYYTATIQYKSGLIFHWTHTWASPPHPHFTPMYEQLVGAKGAIDLSKGLIAFRADAGRKAKEPVTIDEVPRENTTLLALEGFFDSIRNQKPPLVGAKEGRDATLFGLLVRAAVYAKRPVTMEEAIKSVSWRTSPRRKVAADAVARIEERGQEIVNAAFPSRIGAAPFLGVTLNGVQGYEKGYQAAVTLSYTNFVSDENYMELVMNYDATGEFVGARIGKCNDRWATPAKLIDLAR